MRSRPGWRRNPHRPLLGARSTAGYQCRQWSCGCVMVAVRSSLGLLLAETCPTATVGLARPDATELIGERTAAGRSTGRSSGPALAPPGSGPDWASLGCGTVGPALCSRELVGVAGEGWRGVTMRGFGA